MPGRSIFYEKLKQRINNTNNSRWRISNSKRYRRLSKGYVQRCNTRNVRKGAIALELGYEKGDSLNKNTENRRNGYSKKTVKSQFGNIELGGHQQPGAGHGKTVADTVLWETLFPDSTEG